MCTYWVADAAVGLTSSNDRRDVAVGIDERCSECREADEGGERLHLEKK